MLEELADAAAYEGYTPLVAGNRYDKAATKLEQNPQGRLEFDIDDEGTLLHVNATVRGAQLEGVYQGGGEGGKFECQTERDTGWLRSLALVPLYVKRRQGGRAEYTTQVAPGATAIGRVWRNPVRTDVVDRDAKAR